MTNTREQQFIARIAELEAENQALRARVTELEQQVSKPLATPTSPPKSPVPKFVKPKRQKRRRKKPGQKRDTPAVIAIVPPKLTKLLKLL